MTCTIVNELVLQFIHDFLLHPDATLEVSPGIWTFFERAATIVEAN